MAYFLKVDNGNVSMWNDKGQKLKSYYNGGDAVRADWLDQAAQSVQVQLKNGKIKIISKEGVVIKTI